jgi:hypothetical protein
MKTTIETIDELVFKTPTRFLGWVFFFLFVMSETHSNLEWVSLYLLICTVICCWVVGLLEALASLEKAIQKRKEAIELLEHIQKTHGTRKFRTLGDFVMSHFPIDEEAEAEFDASLRERRGGSIKHHDIELLEDESEETSDDPFDRDEYLTFRVGGRVLATIGDVISVCQNGGEFQDFFKPVEDFTQSERVYFTQAILHFYAHKNPSWLYTTGGKSYTAHQLVMEVMLGSPVGTEIVELIINNAEQTESEVRVFLGGDL